MVTVVNYRKSTQLAIEAGLVSIGNGAIAFESKTEAREWASNRYKHGDYEIYQLCPNCDEGSYKDTPTSKYTTMKSIIKNIKVLPK